MYNSITCEGCIINVSSIRNCVIGIRSILELESELENVICMGADYYETDADKDANKQKGRPNIGIGQATRIRNTIIDKNARIGKNCSIGLSELPPEGDHGDFFVKDGIIVITKNAVIHDNTVI